jgi:spore coat polysaccharide biosynthesis protein SpsF
MLDALGVVQACFPTGWSESYLRRRFGDRSLVQWIIRRVTDSARLDGVVVLTRPGRSHEMIQDLVPLDVPVVSAEGPDLLSQLTKALEDYPTESIVRVRADSPFVDPTLIDRLVVAAESKPECDYASYCCHGGRPAVLTPVGLFAEWVRTDALRRAARLARDQADRDAVTSYLFSHPERFRVRLLPAPERIDRDDVRLTVDRDEDWEHALTIIDALGPEGLDWQRIAELLDHQPELRSRMAALNRAG